MDTLTLDEHEKAIILSRLQDLNGNKAEAAKSLGISLKTLYNKLNRYREQDERQESK
ncbi:transcriptional regulatory protein ZraR [Thalassoglobus neptunius]|uniref:Transcriptional regulatory protein ZraR n=1 Tax=Thalassoglobus neptunius TaxID=1938619 RepID=A0A5C5X834_9PLAN|nr:helix-turn-helix domain-containing protein [Thalassoglobus neptunius]TWT58988.1 transcriptional regulatory protein ZraR [Thalassoglobus neptunius]